MKTPKEQAKLARRSFLQKISKGLAFFAFGGLLGKASSRARNDGMVWQIDPSKCKQCGNCATHCVLPQSASRAVHDFSMCGYCRICTGFLVLDPLTIDEGAENQLCPVGAIKRKFVEEPYYEYTIDRDLCIGCAKCVKGCTSYGNGSLFLQVQRDICINCNTCSIAIVCEGKAYSLIPANRQYIPKKKAEA